MNLTGINMFKRHIVDFSKNLEESSDFFKIMPKKVCFSKPEGPL